jgi:hypothetical protein
LDSGKNLASRTFTGDGLKQRAFPRRPWLGGPWAG